MIIKYQRKRSAVKRKMVESVNKTNADGTPEQDKPKVQLQIKSSPVVTTKVI